MRAHTYQDCLSLTQTHTRTRIQAANTAGPSIITGKPQTAAAQMQQMMEARLQAIKDEVMCLRVTYIAY